MVDLKTCKFVVYGYDLPEYHGRKDFYTTHSHTHFGWVNALKYMGREVYWYSRKDEVDKLANEEQIFWISNHDVSLDIPLTKNSFHAIHGGSDYPYTQDRFKEVPHLFWNVYLPRSFETAPGGHPMPFPLPKPTENLGPFTHFWPENTRLDIMWASDLTPDLIDKNKVDYLRELKHKEIHWVGSVWSVNSDTIEKFKNSIESRGIKFIHHGAGQVGILALKENVELVQKSYFGAIVSGGHHLHEKFVSGRSFLNPSCGMMPVTNSLAVYEVLEGLPIYEPIIEKLFDTAVTKLKKTKVTEVWEVMDLIKNKHTFVQRMETMLTAADILLQDFYK